MFFFNTTVKMHLKNQQSLVTSFQVFINANCPDLSKAIIDKEGSILTANDRNFIWPLPIASNFWNILPNRSLVLTPKELQQAHDSNKSICQNVLFKKNDTNYWFRIQVTPLSFKDEMPLFLVDLRDITNFKNIEERAKKQQAQIEYEMLLRTNEIIATNLFVKDHGGFLINFMRGLRHDLLSPVTQLKDIINYYKKTDDPKKKEQSAQYIDNSLERLRQTAQGLSDFVDLYIAPQDGLEAINLKEIFEDTRAVLAEEISKSKAEISYDFTAFKQLHFNKRLMASILYNLLSNAIKFRKKHTIPVIHVNSYQHDENFILAVKDNGTGIDLEKYDHLVFKSFKRLNMEQPGAGIGLSMIKNSLIAYQGDIRLESTPNEGTTVFVSIPQDI
jgi:signal transduction histidine kinase